MTMVTLRRLRQQEMSIGTRLKGPVYNAQGQVLASAGQELSSALLASLPQRVYTDETWPSRRSVQNVVNDVFQRLGRDKPVNCERRHERRRWVVPLTIDIEHKSEIGTVCQRARVTTQDLSIGGFSFIHKQFVPIGVHVLAHFSALADKPVVPGEVRSCVLIKGMEHRVGVRFLPT